MIWESVTLSFPQLPVLTTGGRVEISMITSFLVSLPQVPVPMTGGLDPVLMLTDDAMVAQWNNEGLPGDKMSTQNATILTNCE